MWESSVESKIISFAQNFVKNSLNQSVIRDLIIIMACVCSRCKASSDWLIVTEL